MCLDFKTNKLIRIPIRKNNYLYNATGQKVAKKITNNSTETMTDYLNGFHYENQTLRFFATAEGYVDIKANSINDFRSVNYVYNYTDHLGNIRVSYAFRNATGQAEIMEENHYYPFGLKHKKYGSVDKDLVCVDEDCYEVGIDVVLPQSRKTYQMKYNGKEFQDELGLNFYDFGFRNYAPDLGRWMNVDPLAEKFYNRSPYEYCFSNPINLIDPTGMGPDDPPLKNIYIVIDYSGKRKDARRDTIKFEGMEKEGWHGIVGTNLLDVRTQLESYLGDNKADNIVLESHGGVHESAKGRTESYFTPNNNIEGKYSYLNSEDLRGGKPFETLKNLDVSLFTDIVNFTKEGGNFYLNTCNTAKIDGFFESLHTLTGSKFNLIGNADRCFIGGDMTRASGTSYYTPGKLFNDSFLNSNSGGAKLYPAGYNVGTSSPEKYKNVQINSSGIKLFK